MLNHVLSHNELDDFSEIYAIYSSAEAFELAFSLNKKLGLSFSRAKSDLSFKKSDAHFMVYKHEDNDGAYNMWLYSNSFKKESFNSASELLFKDEIKEFYLLPEVSKADYLLKYSGDRALIKNYERRLAFVSGIVSSHKIPSKKLKSKNNLIAD